jgi:hypothetical protein
MTLAPAGTLSRHIGKLKTSSPSAAARPSETPRHYAALFSCLLGRQVRAAAFTSASNFIPASQAGHMTTSPGISSLPSYSVMGSFSGFADARHLNRSRDNDRGLALPALHSIVFTAMVSLTASESINASLTVKPCRKTGPHGRKGIPVFRMRCKTAARPPTEDDGGGRSPSLDGRTDSPDGRDHRLAMKPARKKGN